MHEFDSPVFSLDMEDYPPVLKAYFGLSRKSTFDFEDVTKRIGLLPTATRSYEDCRQITKDMGYAGAFWEYSTEEEECRDTNEQLDKLISQLRGKEGVINDICDQYNLQLSFTVVVNADVAHMPAMVLSKESIGFIASIGADIGFDTYIDNANPDDMVYGVPESPYLTIGTVVTLKGGTKKLMVYGRVQKDLGSGKTYDYVGCLYPEGHIDAEHAILFNHEDIEDVHYDGYPSVEALELYEKLLELRGQQ